VSTDFLVLCLFCFNIRQHGRQILYFKLHVDCRTFHYRRPNAAVRPQVMHLCNRQYCLFAWKRPEVFMSFLSYCHIRCKLKKVTFMIWSCFSALLSTCCSYVHFGVLSSTDRFSYQVVPRFYKSWTTPSWRMKYTRLKHILYNSLSLNKCVSGDLDYTVLCILCIHIDPWSYHKRIGQVHFSVNASP